MTAVPERIAMCADPNGLHEHVPLRPGEPMLTSCFADCRCTPVEFVRADAYEEAVEALKRLADENARRRTRTEEAALVCIEVEQIARAALDRSGQ